MTRVPADDEVRAMALRLARLGGRQGSKVFRMSRSTKLMLDFAMSSPEFKTQLFRLVDVFPVCADDADVARHVDEYLTGIPLPRGLGAGMKASRRVPGGKRLTAAIVRRSIARMAHQFIAAENATGAATRLEELWRSGEATTVDLLGEKTVTETEADQYAARVAELLETVTAASPAWPAQPRLERDPWGALSRANVSVKPTALAPLFGPLTPDDGLTGALARLRPVLRRARELGATVTIDIEHDDTKDLTFELVRRLGAEFPDGPQLGCVVQAYRRDAYEDLDGLIAWSREHLRVPFQIRLVKGAYWDQETVVAAAEGWPSPVFEARRETDANYERCTRRLIDHAGAVRPAIASHNVRSLAHAIVYAEACGLDDGAVEFQLLYGMAEPVHRALTRLPRRVRVYAPVGELVPGMAYLVRRLLENTSNESFVRHRFAEGRELDELLVPPGVDDATLDVVPSVAPVATDGFVNELHAELRRPAPRARLAAAVDAASSEFPIAAPIIVDGRTRRTQQELMSTDPGHTATVVGRAACAGPRDADDAIDAARAALPEWRARGWQERAAAIRRAAVILRRRRAELAALEVFEAGKPIAEADADVTEAIDFCEYYAHEALRLGEGGAVHQAAGEANAYEYQPRGVGAVISPWNFPLAIPTGMATAALVTGNAVLFKPAEQTPAVGLRLTEVLLEAGVPPGVIAFLPGIGEEIGAYLVEHPEVAFIAFTGSRAVGLRIIEEAHRERAEQRHVKHVIAEMGGKNAVVVDSDADLDVAVPAIVKSAFDYAGQKCSAASRVIVVASRFDELVNRLVGATATVPVGHPRELRTSCGPLIDEDAFRRVGEYRKRAHDEGDVLVERDDGPEGGWYRGPTVAVTDDPSSRIARDEIFGPFLTCLRADDFDQALALANDTEYALTGGLFSRSPARIRHAAAHMRAGNLYVNRAITGARVGRQPFGGYGLSGVGSKAGGPDYVREFVEPRVVTENLLRQGFIPFR